MPHQCTGCGHVFEDGSTEMLGGCPDCGGTKFQFHPSEAEIPAEPTDADPPERPDHGGMTERVGRATTSVRDWVGGGGDDAGSTDDMEPWPESPGDDRTDDADDGIIDADAVEPRLAEDDGESTAQASARGDLADPDAFASTPDRADADPTPGSDSGSGSGFDPGSGSDSDPEYGAADRDQPADLQELREELNDQFESIKVLEPGQYELNLMGLYDREEYVVALQENGRYVIQMPDDWAGRRPEE